MEWEMDYHISGKILKKYAGEAGTIFKCHHASRSICANDKIIFKTNGSDTTTALLIFWTLVQEKLEKFEDGDHPESFNLTKKRKSIHSI